MQQCLWGGCHRPAQLQAAGCAGSIPASPGAAVAASFLLGSTHCSGSPEVSRALPGTPGLLPPPEPSRALSSSFLFAGQSVFPPYRLGLAKPLTAEDRSNLSVASCCCSDAISSINPRYNHAASRGLRTTSALPRGNVKAALPLPSVPARGLSLPSNISQLLLSKPTGMG